MPVKKTAVSKTRKVAKAPAKKAVKKSIKKTVKAPAKKAVVKRTKKVPTVVAPGSLAAESAIENLMERIDGDESDFDGANDAGNGEEPFCNEGAEGTDETAPEATLVADRVESFPDLGCGDSITPGSTESEILAGSDDDSALLTAELVSEVLASEDKDEDEGDDDEDGLEDEDEDECDE